MANDKFTKLEFLSYLITHARTKKEKAMLEWLENYINSLEAENERNILLAEQERQEL